MRLWKCFVLFVLLFVTLLSPLSTKNTVRVHRKQYFLFYHRQLQLPPTFYHTAPPRHTTNYRSFKLLLCVIFLCFMATINVLSYSTAPVVPPYLLYYLKCCLIHNSRPLIRKCIYKRPYSLIFPTQLKPSQSSLPYAVHFIRNIVNDSEQPINYKIMWLVPKACRQTERPPQSCHDSYRYR